MTTITDIRRFIRGQKKDVRRLQRSIKNCEKWILEIKAKRSKRKKSS